MKKKNIILLSFLLGIIFLIVILGVSDKKVYFSLNGSEVQEVNIGEKYKDIFVKTANGYEINMTELKKLSENEQTEVMALYKNNIYAINELLSELNSSLVVEAKAAADERIKILENETNKINEELEARKTAYEDYFDKLDALEEEKETEQSREQLIKQISALTGGADAADARQILPGLWGEGNGAESESKDKVCMIIDNVGLYRVFGLPSQIWDWKSAFEGRMKIRDERLKSVKL